MQFDPKKLGEEADEMIAKLNQQESEKTEAEDQTSDVEDEAITDTVDEAVDDQGVDAPEADTVEPDQPRNEELDLLRKQVEASEQRWKVLQGMINKKDEEINAMRTLLAEFNSQAPQEAQGIQQPEVKNLVTEKDVDEFGTDLVDLVNRAGTQAATNVMQKTVSELMNRISQLENSLTGVQQRSAATAENMFYTELGKLAPNFRELNTDPGFLQWLSEVDPYSGASKLDMLQDAQAKGDVQRTAKFFQMYSNETSPAQVAEQPTAAPSKAKFAAPGKAKSAAPKQESKRMWTRAEIAKVYKDKIAGKITVQKFNELERDIFAAQTEGRVA